jgi:hypothetical protein
MKILVIYQSLIVFRETKIQNVYSNKDLEIAVINTEFDMGDKIVKILTVIMFCIGRSVVWQGH